MGKGFLEVPGEEIEVHRRVYRRSSVWKGLVDGRWVVRTIRVRGLRRNNQGV